MLDTTVLIDALRGLAAFTKMERHLSHGDVLCTTPINVEEIVRGMRPGEIDAAERLVATLEVVPVTVGEGWLAGNWAREYSAMGRTFSQADRLIAATAIASDARLVTGNPKDFPMVEVEHWPAGE